MDKKTQDKFKDLYIQVARDYMSKIKKNLRLLKTQPGNQDLIEDTHRMFHSLKSDSSLAGYMHNHIFCKEAEDLFAKLKENSSLLNDTVLHAVSSGIDSLNESINNIEQNNFDLDLTEVTSHLTV